MFAGLAFALDLRCLKFILYCGMFLSIIHKVFDV